MYSINLQDADFSATFVPRQNDTKTLFSLTQATVGDIGSIILSVPDEKLLIHRTNALNIFRCFDASLWSLYVFSMIIASIVIILCYKNQPTIARSLIYMTLCCIIQYIPMRCACKKIKFMILMILLMMIVFTALIKSLINTDLVAIDMSQFLDNADQLEKRDQMNIYTDDFSSFYLYLKSTKTTRYKSIRERFERKNIVIHSVNDADRAIKQITENEITKYKTCFVLTDAFLTNTFKFICPYMSGNKFYVSKHRMFPNQYFFPYSTKLSAQKVLKIEFL